MKKQRFMDLSMFICPCCHKSFPIMRNHGKHREKGHIKDIWCPFCKTERKFKEIGRGDFGYDNRGLIYM